MDKQPNSHYCFICGVKNVAGVHVRFYETTDNDGHPEILARFTGQPIHQGYPGRMHGGVLTGILDETIGRAINYGAGVDVETWGVTAELATRFHRAAPLGVELTARGRITRENRRLFEGSGEIYLPDGSVAVSARGKFLKLPLDAISAADAEALGWRVYPDETVPEEQFQENDNVQSALAPPQSGPGIRRVELLHRPSEGNQRIDRKESHT